MHNYTNLKKQELSAMYSKKRQQERGRQLSDLANRGMLSSSAGVMVVPQIGSHYINLLINELIPFEKSALIHDQLMPDETYYQNLKEELCKIAIDEYEIVRSNAIDPNFINPNDTTLIFRAIENYISETKQSIDVKVDLLKEEVRMGIGKPVSALAPLTIGGDVAVVNTGIIYGSVQGRIEKIKKEENAELLKSVASLLDAINKAQIDENSKVQYMQNIEYLLAQYELPKKQRTYGVINAALQMLATSSDLITLWSQFGPAIIAAFQ